MTTVRFSASSSPSAAPATPPRPERTPEAQHVMPSKRMQPSKSFRRSAGERAVFRRGDRVEEIEGYIGTVAWVGTVRSGDVHGEYIGVVWEEGAERGHLDGEYKGVRYFTCEAQCGSLCTSSQLRLHKASVSEGTIMKERQRGSHLKAAVAARMHGSATQHVMFRYFSQWGKFKKTNVDILVRPPTTTKEVHCYCSLM